MGRRRGSTGAPLPRAARRIERDRRGRGARAVLALALAASTTALAAVAEAPEAAAASCAIATRTWDGGAGTTAWTDAVNWSGNVLPGVNDHVCIPAGAPGASVDIGTAATVRSVEAAKPVTITGSLTVTDTGTASAFASLGLSGAGVLSGAGARTVSGTLTWEGGLGGAGMTTALPGSTVNVSGSNATLSSTLRTQGAVTFDGPNFSGVGFNGGTWEHSGSMTLDTANGYNDQLYSAGGTNLLRVTAGGTITKTGATDAYLQIPVDNDGTITATQGSVRLSAGSGPETSTGELGATGAGRVALEGGDTHRLAGVDLVGTGRVAITGSAEAAGAVHVTTTATLELDAGGTLTGGGAVTIDGRLDWDGSLSGTGTTTALPGSTVNVSGSSATLSSTLRTQGAVTFDGPNFSGVGFNGGTWEHSGTMTLDTANGYNDQLYSAGGTNLLRVTAGGTITKTGTTDAYLGVPVDNDGTITATQGSLQLTDGSGPETSTGSYGGAATGRVVLYGVHHVASANMAGGGTVNVNGTIDAVGPVVVAAGTTLALVGGTLSGPGNRRIDGALEWAGTIAGSGSTTATAGSTVNVTGSSALAGVLTTEGDVVFDGPNFSGVVFNGGTWEHSGSMTLDTANGYSDQLYSAGGTNLLRVTAGGTITKTGATDAYLQVPVDNDGTVTATQGALLIGDLVDFDPGTHSLSGGTYAVTGGATLRLDGVSGLTTLDATVSSDGPGSAVIGNGGLPLLANLATITSNGGLRLRNDQSLTTPGPLTTAGTVTIGATSSLTTTGLYRQTSGSTTLEVATSTLTATGSRVDVEAGTLSGRGTVAPQLRSLGTGTVSPGLSPGTLAAAGVVALNGTTTIEINGTTPGTLHDRIAATGAVTAGGTLVLQTGAAFNPPVGTTVDIVTGSSVTGTFSGITGLSAGTGKGWSISYPAGAVRATVVSVPGADVVASAAPVGTAFNVGFPGSWQVTVRNVGGAASSGTATVVLTLGAGQTLASTSGTGWSCTGTGPVTCSRGGAMAPGASLPVLTVNVNVSVAAVPTTTLGLTVANVSDTRTDDNTFATAVPARSLVPPQALFSASATRITVPAAVSFSAGASTGTITNYVWDFGDGSTGSGLTPTHTYTSPGIYTVSLRVENEVQSDVALPVQIEALAFQPLTAAAGDDRTTVTGTGLQFDAGGSTPGDIDAWTWDFGDGQTATTPVATHAWTAAGVYTVTLTVHRGSNTASDTATVRVFPSTGAALTVTVTNGSSPITGASVTVIDATNVRYSATTGGAGTAALRGLPNGSYAVYAYAPGFLPAVGTATVQAGSGAVTIALSSGAVATQTIESRRLTYDEIIAAGIDPNDPANQNVYSFTICLAFGNSACTATFQGVAGDGVLYSPSFGGSISGVACTATECSGTAPDGRYVTVEVEVVGGQPVAQFLLIPGEARWLKEFFEVQMVVQNLAPPGFTFQFGQATLDIPPGLALAPTSTPQDATVAVPNIPGGESRSATWILRGDEAGLYDLTAQYSGFLDPVGAAIDLSATTAEPLRVWGGSALTMTVTADDVAEAYHPYRVSITLTNVTDTLAGGSDPTPVYNPTVEVLASGGANWIMEPAARFVQGTARIDPGQSFTADYVLLPDFSGVLNVAGSFVFHTGEGPDLADTIVSQPRELPVPSFTSTPSSTPGSVVLSWAPVAGATDYVIYRTASPLTPFEVPPVPVVTVAAPTTSVTVPATAYRQWYAIGTVSGGISRVKHRLLEVVTPPRIVPGAGGVSEGNTGTSVLGMPVTLSWPSEQTVSVKWSTVAGTNPTPGVDYLAASNQTITFAPGDVSQPANITVLGDTLDENGQLFGADWVGVLLSTPTNGTLSPGFGSLGFALIFDDDLPPIVRSPGVAVLEGGPTSRVIQLPVRLSEPSGNTVTVNWRTVDTVTEPQPGVEYTPASGSITFLPGETEKAIPVTITGDTVDEPGQAFGAEWGAVVLETPANATLDPVFLGNIGFFLIFDDD